MNDVAEHIVAIKQLCAQLEALAAPTSSKNSLDLARVFRDVKDHAVLGAAIASEQANEMSYSEMLARHIMISGTATLRGTGGR